MRTKVAEGQLSLLDIPQIEQEKERKYNFEMDKIRRVVSKEQTYLTSKQGELTKEDLLRPKAFAEKALEQNLAKAFPNLTIKEVKLDSNKIALTYDIKSKEKEGHAFNLKYLRGIKGANFDKLLSQDFNQLKEAIKDVRKSFLLFAPALEKEATRNLEVWKEVKADVSKQVTVKEPTQEDLALEYKANFQRLSKNGYVKEPSPALKVQAYYPDCQEFKFLNDNEASNILAIRELAPLQKGSDLLHTARLVIDSVEQGKLPEVNLELAENCKNAMYKCEKEVDYLECKADIVDQFIVEFPEIKHIKGEVASILVAYQLESDEFESIKDINKSYKKLGKQLEKMPEGFEKDNLKDTFKGLSKAVQEIDRCKKVDITERSALAKSKQQDRER